jgi:hypothetical protein
MYPVKSIRHRLFRQRRFRQLLITTIVIAVLMGLAIIPLEKDTPGSKFQTPFDGVYWAITTLTTVGYGDLAPVTYFGRLLAIVLQVMGALTFGLIVAMIGSYVERAQDEFYWSRVFERLDRLEQEMVESRRRTEFLLKDKNKVQ